MVGAGGAGWGRGRSWDQFCIVLAWVLGLVVMVIMVIAPSGLLG